MIISADIFLLSDIFYSSRKIFSFHKYIDVLSFNLSAVTIEFSFAI